MYYFILSNNLHFFLFLLDFYPSISSVYFSILRTVGLLRTELMIRVLPSIQLKLNSTKQHPHILTSPIHLASLFASSKGFWEISLFLYVFLFASRRRDETRGEEKEKGKEVVRI